MAAVEPDAFVGGRVPRDLLEAFQRVAEENDRTISAELRRVMKAHVEAHEEQSTIPSQAAA